jgi:2-polyprenyl-3-methyl-5-hydroxy-6-metoxy-1,4-benzoquinol methylase
MTKPHVREEQSPEDIERYKIWYSALKLPERTLEQTLAEEVALYFGQSIDQVIDRWRAATERLKKEWIEQNPQTEAEIVAYYNTNATYIYELSYWHSLYMNPAAIENARSLQKALSLSGRSYLDFGGGIGSNIILFNRHGFDCTLADISSSLLKFAQWRFERRQIRAKIIDMKLETLPDNEYDFVTVVETLEHVEDPVQLMRTITAATKPGGVIVAWTPFYHDELRPMHIATDLSLVEQFVSVLGLEEISRDDGMFIRYYRKPF